MCSCLQKVWGSPSRPKYLSVQPPSRAPSFPTQASSSLPPSPEAWISTQVQICHGHRAGLSSPPPGSSVPCCQPPHGCLFSPLTCLRPLPHPLPLSSHLPSPALRSFPRILQLEVTDVGASLVAQWLRVCLPMQGTRVRALIWEDPTCRGATRPVSHNY